MRRRRSGTVLALMLIVGAIVGSAIANVFSGSLPIVAESIVIGINPPFTIDLSVLSLTLGGTLALNLGAVAGIILALVWYWRM